MPNDDLPLPGPGEPGARLPIEGTLNFRDVGGYATVDGRTMRTGRVYRSDHLNTVTDAGFEALRALGLRSVVDLRMPAERARQPSRLPADVEVVLGHASGADDAAQIELMEEIRAGRVTHVDEQEIVEMYEGMLADATTMFAAVLRTVADAARRPVLFHCTAGKDRTGLSAALVQRLCGVPDESIVRDFALTNPYRTEIRMRVLGAELAAVGIDIELIRPLIVAPVPALRAALAWIDRNGGTEGYAVDACGVPAAAVAALRDALVG